MQGLHQGIALHRKIHNFWPSLTHDASKEGISKLHRMDRVCLEPCQGPYDTQN
jgi:hypothetical protein